MSPEMQTTTISDLAKTLSVSVRKINMRDPNVFQREQSDPARNIESLAFREAIRFERETLQAEVRGNGRYLVLELKAAPNTGSWSINEPDQITLTRAVQNPFAGSAVFASGGVLSPKAIEIIQRGSFQKLLKELDMGVGESLNFYKNAVVYYARSDDASKFLERTDAICHFVAKMTGPEKVERRQVDLPELFAGLNEYAQEWAISDDSKRAEAFENAPAGVLESLVERVAPQLAGINKYLDTHSGERDAALSNLAETVSEAQIVLQQRHLVHAQ